RLRRGRCLRFRTSPRALALAAVDAFSLHDALPIYFGALSGREPPKDSEQGNTLQRYLIELGRMACQGILRLREHHTPGKVGRLAPELAVNKVSNTPCAQANRHQRSNEIGNSPESSAGFPTVPPHCQHDAQ